MAARMVSPATQSLLVLYDDAQSIYQKQRRLLQLRQRRHQGERAHQHP